MIKLPVTSSPKTGFPARNRPPTNVTARKSSRAVTHRTRFTSGSSKKTRFQRFRARVKRLRYKLGVLVGGKNRNKKRLTVWMKIARQVIRESVFPIAIGFAWATIKYSDATTLSTTVGHGLAALTVALVIQGNLLRIAKNIRDKEHVKRTAISFRDVKADIDTIKNLSWSIFSAVKKTSATSGPPASSNTNVEEPAVTISPTK